MASYFQGVRAPKYRRIRNGSKTLIDGLPMVNTFGDVWYVDGSNGSNTNDGHSPDSALASIATAISKASDFDVIFIFPKDLSQSSTDPSSYAEALTVNVPHLSLVGLGTGRTQGGLPQISKGSGSAALMSIEAPGVYVSGLGFNGNGSTGGGIKLRADGSTLDAFGAVIENCHFKNCVGSTATNAATGGAIQLSGSPWQILIYNNKFYKNVGGIVLLDTSNSVPQDLAIIDNSFASSPANVDCDIYLAGGSGPGTGLVIRGNDFGAQPALSSGTNAVYMNLTGADGGLLADNFFGNSTGTFKAAGDAGLIPATVFMAGNYDEAGLMPRDT